MHTKQRIALDVWHTFHALINTACAKNYSKYLTRLVFCGRFHETVTAVVVEELNVTLVGGFGTVKCFPSNSCVLTNNHKFQHS